jgi:GDP-L-fucose synthase
MLKKNSTIFLAGHKGMVGSAILRKLKLFGYTNIIVENKKNLNLLDQKKVHNFINRIKPKVVIIAAARVGGIFINSRNKANFIYQNLTIQNNLIHGSYLAGVKKLIFLGSSCVYPKFAPQPVKEEHLLSGKLESTNDAYAVAKISGIMMCKSYSEQFNLEYKCLMPPNMYGPNDNYDTLTSHFFSALIKKIYLAKKNNLKTIKIWGDGSPKRELLFVDDFAEACIFFMKVKTKENLINIGGGVEKKIIDHAKFIMKKLNIKKSIIFDKSKPNGTPRKILNYNIAKKYGWKPKTTLDKGFDLTLKDFIQRH